MPPFHEAAGGLLQRRLLSLQTDERLAALVREGVEPAFAVIVSRHRPPLVRYCTRIVGRDRAEDVVQLTLERAYGRIAAGGELECLRSWLFRVAHNAALDSLRDRAHTHVQLDEQIKGVERPDQAFERLQSVRDVVAAMQRLPDHQRDAIVLREVEGHSYEEIAGELGVSAGAVRQLIWRARTTLRAGVSAVTPTGLLLRLPWHTGSEPLSARVAELAGGTGAPVVLAQVCATAIVTCAAVGGGGGESRPVPREAAAPPPSLPARVRDATARAATVAASARPAAPPPIDAASPPPAEPSDSTPSAEPPPATPEGDKPLPLTVNKPQIRAPGPEPLPPADAVPGADIPRFEPDADVAPDCSDPVDAANDVECVPMEEPPAEPEPADSETDTSSPTPGGPPAGGGGSGSGGTPPVSPTPGGPPPGSTVPA